MDATRRAALGSAAAVIAAIPALALPALAAEPDPILGVIAAHRAAWRAFDHACGVEDLLHMTLYKRLGSYEAVDECGDPDLQAAKERWSAAADAEASTLLGFLRAVPVTAEGVIAKLAYMAEARLPNLDRHLTAAEWGPCLATIIAAVSRLTGATVPQ